MSSTIALPVAVIPVVRGNANRNGKSRKSRTVLSPITDDTHFIINTRAFHNATLLREFLPRYLTVPRALHLNRSARLQKMGEALVVTQGEKRVETNRKAAETRRINKEKKAAKAAQGESVSGGTDMNTTASLIQDALGTGRTRSRKRKRTSGHSDTDGSEDSEKGQGSPDPASE